MNLKYLTRNPLLTLKIYKCINAILWYVFSLQMDMA